MAALLTLTLSVTAFSKGGTISTTRNGTISTTAAGTISTTAAGTISTTRTGTISTTGRTLVRTPERVGMPLRSASETWNLMDVLFALYQLW